MNLEGLKEMGKYLLIAIVAGGAIPIILAYLTRKHKKNSDKK